MSAILYNLRCSADVPRLRTRWSGVLSGRTKINKLAAMFLRPVLLNGRCAIQMAFVAHFCSVEWLMKRPFDYRCQGSGRVMAHAVPSQVCNFIVKIFPDLDAEPAEKGQHGNRRATDVRAVLDLLGRIPDELIRLSADDDALFWANASALRNAWEDRVPSTNHLLARPLSGAEHTSLFEVKRLLAKCPDEAPAVQTTGLEFLPNDRFRDGLRTDISSANSALLNHEYKAASVLGGSVVEALLLWGLE